MNDLKLVTSNHQYKKTPPLGKLTLVASHGKIITKPFELTDSDDDAASIYAAIQEIREQLDHNARESKRALKGAK